MWTILLVEDEPAELALIAIVLEKAGFRVLPARNATEAQEIFAFRSREIDLIVTDVTMPGMSGPEMALAMIHGGNPQLPFIFISGFADFRNTEFISSIPNRAYLDKPFAPAALIQTVRRMLGAE